MRRMYALLLLLPCLVAGLRSAHAQGAEEAALEVYEYPRARLALQYPAAFSKERPGVNRLFGEFAVFALDPKRDPYGLGADPCAPLAVGFGTGEGFNRLSDRKHKAETDAYGVRNARGTLTMTEIAHSCLPQSALDDAILEDLAGRALKEKDIATLARVQYASIQGNTVWWSIGAGYAANAKGKRKPSQGLVIFATAAATVDGHVLVWRMSANSPSAFNRLSEVSICFTAPTCTTGFSRLIPFQLNTPTTGRAAGN